MKVSIVGANGAIGSEVTRHFLARGHDYCDRLALLTKSQESYKQLSARAEDSLSNLGRENIDVSTKPSALAGSDVVIFCAGSPVLTTRERREALFNDNLRLLTAYLSKFSKFCPNASVISITNPTTALLQATARRTKTPIVSTGITVDTLRLREEFLREFGTVEKRLYMIGDHGTIQAMTLSQIDPTIAERIRREEKEYLAAHSIKDIYGHIREENYRLLRRCSTDAMFGFADSLPLKYRGLARQRFIHFITRTTLSSAKAVLSMFDAVVNEKKPICTEAIFEYQGLQKAAMGIPAVFEDHKPVPVELSYSNDELETLRACAVKYAV